MITKSSKSITMFVVHAEAAMHNCTGTVSGCRWVPAHRVDVWQDLLSVVQQQRIVHLWCTCMCHARSSFTVLSCAPEATHCCTVPPPAAMQLNAANPAAYLECWRYIRQNMPPLHAHCNCNGILYCIRRHGGMRNMRHPDASPDLGVEPEQVPEQQIPINGLRHLPECVQQTVIRDAGHACVEARALDQLCQGSRTTCIYTRGIHNDQCVC